MLKFSALALVVLLAVGNCDVVKKFTTCDVRVRHGECKSTEFPISCYAFSTDSTGKLIELRIVPCPGSKCILKKNTNVSIEIDFQTNEKAASLEIDMYGVLPGLPPIPWNGVSKKACDNTIDANGKPACPVQDGGQVLNYKNSFLVSPMYPALSLDVMVTITDTSKNTLVCVKFPVKIEA